MDRSMKLGRWQNLCTARVYINTALVELSEPVDTKGGQQLLSEHAAALARVFAEPGCDAANSRVLLSPELAWVSLL